MQDFEVPRWEAAQQTFKEAFALGYSNAKAELASGQATQTGEAESVFYVDVGRDPIVDGDGSQFAPRFYTAGYEAAIARRRSEESCIDVLQGPDHHDALLHGRCRWVVMLDAPVIAVPQPPGW